MRLLFLHQNFPGQFRHLAGHFAADPGNRVLAIGEASNLEANAKVHPRIELHPYATPQPANAATHRYAQPYEAAVHRGLAVATLCEQFKSAGFVPDLVMAHPGWGDALFVRDVFPESRLIQHAEFYYHPAGSDVGFDPEFPAAADSAFRLRVKNTTQMMSMEQADMLFAPTEWQKSRLPELLQARSQVVHDGIDTTLVQPNPAARITLARAGITLSAGDEVITYVARNLEPYRGFHIFMRALPHVLKLRPKARVLIVGGDAVSYGSKPADGRTWRQTLMDEVGAMLDPGRVHFLGRLPYAGYLQVLQVSSVHAYLTYPFVLSWSLLEAMAAGCMVVGSRTAPVEEVITDGENGWLTDFFDHRALAGMLSRALEQRGDLNDIRDAARKTIVDRFDLRGICLPRQLELLQPLVR
ncbi:MAG: glycosyltransferase [Rhodocyclales bacterium]|nr:glycosyltransferase [Rhodocyclales bacterium]